jgi:hypothetical protein
MMKRRGAALPRSPTGDPDNDVRRGRSDQGHGANADGPRPRTTDTTCREVSTPLTLRVAPVRPSMTTMPAPGRADADPSQGRVLSRAPPDTVVIVNAVYDAVRRHSDRDSAT